MAADDARTVLRVPGRLSYGCTDLTAAWPHGGTGLGATRALVLAHTGSSYPVTAEAFGGEPVEYLESGELWGMGCFLRGYDYDALGVLFPNTATGTTSQERVVSAPGSVKAGSWASARSVKLVFTPEGSTHAAAADTPDAPGPFVILYRAIPMLRESFELALERRQEFQFPALFQGIRDASSRIMAFGPRGDLSL